DLVDAGDVVLVSDPRYRETRAYGNILIEPDGAGNRQIVHYGGDSATTARYRKGTLYFYNNTVVSTRTDRTTLFRLSTNEERCESRNNIFYATAGGRTVSLLDTDGVIDLSHNWIQPGWVRSFGEFRGAVSDDGTMMQGTSPGFLSEAEQDFGLLPDSPAINAGSAADDVKSQYVKHQSGEPRFASGGIDLGAFEFSWIREIPRARRVAP